MATGERAFQGSIMPFVSAAIFIMGSLAFPANTTLLQTLTLAHITHHTPFSARARCKNERGEDKSL